MRFNFTVKVIARFLAKHCHRYEVAFVTHSAHKLLFEGKLASIGASFHGISSPPSAPSYALAARNSFLDQTAHRQECYLAVKAAIDGSSCMKPGLIIFNLFALEGYHLAEHFNYLAMAAAPYMLPHCAPTNLESRVGIKLVQRLKKALPGEVAWPEMEHWMWPLMGSRWSQWRERDLGLTPCPLIDPFTSCPKSYDWPKTVPLLYGFSASVVEVPGHWPNSIVVSGFWFPEDDENFIPSAALTSFLEADDILPLFAGFSSMGTMGFLTEPQSLLRTLVLTLERTNQRAVLLTSGYPPLDDAALCWSADSTAVGFAEAGSQLQHSRLSDGIIIGNGRLFCTKRNIPHQWILPRCQAAIHHGGSGTAAAVLRAGIPHVICPFFFDQFYWADRLAWMGVASQPLRPADILSCCADSVSCVSSAVQFSLREEVRMCAQQLSLLISREDGVAVAVRAIEELTSEGVATIA